MPTAAENHDARVRVNTSGCLDRCELGPTVVIYPEGVWYSVHTREDNLDVQLVNRRQQLEAEESSYVIRDGIIVIPRGTVVPDGTII